MKMFLVPLKASLEIFIIFSQLVFVFVKRLYRIIFLCIIFSLA